MDYYDFPFWIRFGHFINVIFITLLIRSGIEIFSALPKLYWSDDAKPGTEWLKLSKKKIPENRLWTSLEEEEDFSSWLALPGHKSLGLGRHWHFFSMIFWLINGFVYCILLFSSNEWQRLVPTNWSIFPQAVNTALVYASFHSPPPGDPYNPLQQLMYFGVVFLLGPFMIATGAAMSPAVDARFPRYPKVFGGRQVARSLHFLGMAAFCLFIIMHISMVLIEHFPQNMGNILLDNPRIDLLSAAVIFAFYITIVAIIHVFATLTSLKRPRRVQNTIDFIVNPIKWLLFHKAISKQEHKRSNISSFFRVNGKPPENAEYKELLKDNFASWKLKIFGLVESPVELSLADLRQKKKQTQVTEHYCIQGWTAIAEWSGAQMHDIISICRPLPTAKFVVFRSFQSIEDNEFYEVLSLNLMKDPQTILAYEMNGLPLDIGHGAPLRLRVETQLGYKMVKWIRSIEFVSGYKNIGLGQGGHREDHMYYSRLAGI
jgi:methionine sulfoxide reductase catalytic subunit